jgi:hypothetical protein
MKGFKGIATYQTQQRKSVMQYGMIVLNPYSQHKVYIYDFDILNGCKKRFTSDFWEEYRKYKGFENLKLPKSVIMEVCKRVAEGWDFKDITGSYPYSIQRANKEEQEEVYVTYADAYVYPVKYFFRRKSACEKQAINYPCQGEVCALNKSHKFGEGCDVNTEPSLIVILRRCND